MSEVICYSVVTMNNTIASLVDYFASRKCGYELNADKDVLQGSIDAGNACWRFMALRDDAGRFVMVSFIPLKAPEARRSACAELFARVNANLGLGHFDLDFNDGELAYRTVVPLTKKGRLKGGIIEHVLHGHQVIVDRFIPIISSVIFAGLCPENALTAEEPPSIAPQTRFSLN